MIFDDNRPDYFLDGEEDPASAEAPTPTAGDTISFATPSPTPGSSEATLEASATRRRHPWRRFWGWLFFLLALALGVTFWLRYLNPYVTDAKAVGYITKVERRGIICKTYEGEMITESALTDTVRLYSRDFTFSIPNDSLARILQGYQGSGRPITIKYERYYGTLPWRGSSMNILTAIEPQ
ncbi:MAG: hypothetical protein LIO90_02825 [Bacteroidales bacterium]|nr:hypothetical protein [Bacteroidales bacterium]